VVFRIAPLVSSPNPARRHGNKADSGGMAVDYRLDQIVFGRSKHPGLIKPGPLFIRNLMGDIFGLYVRQFLRKPMILGSPLFLLLCWQPKFF